MQSLNISNNKLVSFKLPVGWSGPDRDGDYEKPGGGYQKELPAGAEPFLDAIIALADGIKNNGALAKLDISNNGIPDDQQANLKGICTSKGINLKL